MNIIEPTFSFFQAIIKAIINKKEGIKCINNANKTAGKLYPSVKTSNENKPINRINKIPNILGIQYKYLFLILITFI